MKRKRSQQIKDDPGVAEVRRWRAKLWKRGGGTLKGVMELLQKVQAEEKAAGRVYVRTKSAVRSMDKKKRRAA